MHDHGSRCFGELAASLPHQRSNSLLVQATPNAGIGVCSGWSKWFSPFSDLVCLGFAGPQAIEGPARPYGRPRYSSTQPTVISATGRRLRLSHRRLRSSWTSTDFQIGKTRSFTVLTKRDRRLKAVIDVTLGDQAARCPSILNAYFVI